MIKRAWHNFKHKISFWKKDSLKKKMVKYGFPFLIILIAWEIVEDIIIPAIAYLLGLYVDPTFYAAIPITWVVCLHPFVVPVLWYYWCFVFNKDGDQIETHEE